MRNPAQPCETLPLGKRDWGDSSCRPLLHQQMPKDRRGAGTLPHFPEFWEFTGARCLFISTYIKMYTAHHILVSSSQIVFLLMQDHLHLSSFGLRKRFLVSACCSEIDLPYFPVNNCSQVYCLLVFPAEMLTPCQALGAVVKFLLTGLYFGAHG